jgi:hypothetical protein
MKLGLCVSILAVVSVVTVTYASGQSKQSQQGTIVQVQKQDVADPAVRTGAAATRAPLQSHYYLYNVSVQLNCDLYVGRYETELDDLPSALSANSSVPVRIEKRLMYLDFPGNTVQMRIVRHKVSQQGTCDQTASAK